MPTVVHMLDIMPEMFFSSVILTQNLFHYPMMFDEEFTMVCSNVPLNFNINLALASLLCSIKWWHTNQIAVTTIKDNTS